MAGKCAECGKKISFLSPLYTIDGKGEYDFCSGEHRDAYESRWLAESKQTGSDELDDGQSPLETLRAFRGERSPVGNDAGSGNGDVYDGRRTIAGLADFYSGLTVFVFWLFICGCVVGLLGWFLADGSAELIFVSVLGLSIFGVIATGATAVLLDIMHNIRENNRKQAGD